MARASIEDPIKVFRFRVVIDGFVRFGFTDVTGLNKETEEAKYREGTMPTTPQKSSGLTNFGDITLKRGQIIGSSQGGDTDMIDWSDSVANLAASTGNNNYRKDLEIEQYNALNVKVRVWRVTQAWPKNFKPMSDLSGTSSDNSMEELILANEGFERVL
jgi:phage tail-like protein